RFAGTFQETKLHLSGGPKHRDNSYGLVNNFKILSNFF
ncbi:MAG: hypothetical protein ACJAVK_000461, partial [Akkermansiaceae bacterium]